MVREEIPLKDPRLEATVRILAASVNARILHYLVEARRRQVDDGWRFLSQIAEDVGESPGSVSLALQKLLPLLEERRHKGRRYFRARARVSLLLETF
jgi:DNA-binding transcriptional ArsR family regulator